MYGGSGVRREEGPTAQLKQSQFSIQGPSQQLGEMGGKSGKSHISAQVIFVASDSPLLSNFKGLVA